MIRLVNENYSFIFSDLTQKLENITKELNLRGDITIKFGNSSESESLNTEFRNKNYPTDVLSFPINEQFPDSYYIGDIFVCFPIAEKQAFERNISIEEELFTLIVHGILHLGGYDHENDTGEMLKLQDRIVNEYFHKK